ncbi:WD40-repeat-containing domain protein [Baffinella frigidus]|nr:WD40-repeat-containing domain protein [Cryptophyta sp. CCMP2293]
MPSAGTSEDALQRVLHILVRRVEPGGAAQWMQVCKEWGKEMEARGACRKTLELCSALAHGGKREHLGQTALERLNANTDDEQCIDANAFLQRFWAWRGTLHEWLQAASQEPDASFLSRGAASTAEMLGLPLVRWVGKPEGRYPGISTLTGHSEEVLAVAFAPDGTRVVSGSADTLVKIWNAATGAEVCMLKGHLDAVLSVAFSPDGKHVVSGSSDNLVKIWDASIGALVSSFAGVCTLKGHLGEVNSVGFSADGTRVVSGSVDQLVKIWDAKTGAELHTLGHSCSGRCICTLSEYGILDTNEECQVPAHSRDVNAVSFSPDGTRVVSGSADTLVKIWDVASEAEVCTLTGHSSSVTSVAFSADGKRVVSGSADKLVKIWDSGSGAEMRTLLGHSNEVNSVGFSPDGTRVVSGSADKLVKIWNTATGGEGARTRSSYSYSKSADKLVKICNAATGAEVCTLTGHSSKLVSPALALGTDSVCSLTGHANAVWAVAFSPDGKRVVSGSHESLVKIWHAETGGEVCNPRGHSRAVWAIGFSPDGTRAVSGSADNLVKIWDTATGAEVWSTMSGFHAGKDTCLCTMQTDEYGDQQIVRNPMCTLTGHVGGVNAVKFSPDGKIVVSGSRDWLLKIWNAGSGAERVVSASRDWFLKIWNAENGSEVCTLKGHACGVTCVAFSADGTRVVSGSEDELVKIWDTGSGAAVCTMRGHESAVTRVEFSENGERVISESEDRQVRVWDAASGQEVPVKEFAFVESASKTHTTTRRHSLAASGDTLLITDLDGTAPLAFFKAPQPLTSSLRDCEETESTVVGGEGGGARAACFKAPQPITAVRSHGAAIVVGCEGGAVCLLEAPFLAV